MQMFTWISIKTVPDTSLHETSDLIYAIEVYYVETTFMIKAVKSYHYNKKKHCNIRVDDQESELPSTSYSSRIYCFHNPIQDSVFAAVRGGADKSLARTGRKKATANKLGIYSTYSPRSSINFLARCSNFCKPLNKIQKVVRPTRSPRQQWPPRRKKNGELSIVFFSPGNRW